MKLLPVASILVCISFCVSGMDEKDSLPDIMLGNPRNLAVVPRYTSAAITQDFRQRTMCHRPPSRYQEPWFYRQTRASRLRASFARREKLRVQHQLAEQDIRYLLWSLNDMRRKFYNLLRCMRETYQEIDRGYCRDAAVLLNSFRQLLIPWNENQELWHQLVERREELYNLAVERGIPWQ